MISLLREYPGPRGSSGPLRRRLCDFITRNLSPQSSLHHPSETVRVKAAPRFRGMALVVQLERGTTLRAAGGLPPVELRTLTLPDPLSPSTWTVQWQSGAASETASFSGVMRELQFPPRTFISVAQDNDGQHRFIRLEDVLAGMAPQLVSEAAVKQLPDALKLYARHAGGATAPAPVNTMAELPKEMAPHSFGSNYRSERLLEPPCLQPPALILAADAPQRGAMDWSWRHAVCHAERRVDTCTRARVMLPCHAPPPCLRTR
jgi:hypothetical protein